MRTEGAGKSWVIPVTILVLFAVLSLRLLQLQVLKSKGYSKVSAENRLRVEKLPAPRGIIYDRNGIPLVKNSAYYSASLLPEMAGEADTEAIAALLGMDEQDVLGKIKTHHSQLQDIRLKEGLSFREVANIEARLSDHRGLTISTEQTRHYIYGNLGAHLIGYLGRMNRRQANSEQYKGVPPQSFVGQWGIEKLYDSTLRGTPGKRVIEVDALGRQLKVLKVDPPRRGDDLYLSLDINLQRIAEAYFTGKSGALVAMKPTTGEILGLVSRPSFNPNLFSRGIGLTDWQRLRHGKRFPLLNRALQSQYPPGSTFKIVTAIAALETGAITPETEFTCTGKLKIGRWSYRCWKKEGHGRIALRRAIVESCDIYFYKAARKTGIDNIARYARLLGLGSPLGIPLVREKPGLIPDREWKKRVKGEPWYLGETFHAAIGQGFVLTTPAQMARMISAVSSGGLLYAPHLTRLDAPPAPIANSTISAPTLKFIVDALSGVVHDPHGTGYAARSPKTEVAGKTGTAQVISLRDDDRGEEEQERFRDHAWFVAFAPREAPEIALSVLVEHGGHGGSAAAPIARAAIEAYLESMKEHAEDRPKADN